MLPLTLEEDVGALAVPWIPTAELGVRTVPAGRWWDAVEVHSFAAVCVLGELTGRCGPVVEDEPRRLAWWLAPVGAASAWDLPEARVLGHGHYLTIPPAEWRWRLWEGGPPIRWLVPPLSERHLADPAVLRPALTRAIRHGMNHD